MKTAVFTIVSNNYSAQARVLCRSLAAHEPGWDRYVLVVDAPWHQRLIPPDLARTIYPDAIRLPLGPWFFSQYNVLEANCAVKPWMLEWLFDQGYDAVLYLDPDIQVFSPFDELREALREYDLILTPHLLEPYADQLRPGEKQIRQTGVFNLGFAAFRHTPNARAALRWWQGKLRHDCRVDLQEGLFVDQVWMDFAPVFFQAHIFREPGYNVAYWNLHERHLGRTHAGSPQFTVNARPLRFFHFSGFVYDNPPLLSRHQNRYQPAGLPEGVEEHLLRYAESLKAEDYAETYSIPYQLGTIDGLRIPDWLRGELLQTPFLEAAIRHESPMDGLAAQILEFLHRPDSKYPWFPHLWARIYRERPDLQRAFPGCATGGSVDVFAEWFENFAWKEYDLAPCFPSRGWWTDSAAVPATSERKANGPQGGFARLLAAWKKRPVEPKEPPAARFQPPALQVDEKPLINLYGFFRAPTGVGEMARSLHRALTHLGYPHRMLALRQVPEVSHPLNHPGFGLPSCRAHIDLFAHNIDGFAPFVHRHPEVSEPRRYRIQQCAWELDVPPPGLAEALPLIDEIWCLSSTNAAVFQRETDKPVRFAGLNLPPEILEPQPFPFQELRPQERRIWLTLCDCDSYPERKGPDRALEAYLQAFPVPQKDTGLLIKLSNAHRRPDVLRNLQQRIGDRPDIWLRDVILTRSETNGMLQHCFGLISLHANEGFGIPIAEAIALGKPVVVTGYGGNMDFCTPENAHLVPYILVPLEEDLPPYHKGNLWARPDLDVAAQLIRQSHEQPRRSTECLTDFNQRNFDRIAACLLAVEKQLENGNPRR